MLQGWKKDALTVWKAAPCGERLSEYNKIFDPLRPPFAYTVNFFSLPEVTNQYLPLNFRWQPTFKFSILKIPDFQNMLANNPKLSDFFFLNKAQSFDAPFVPEILASPFFQQPVAVVEELFLPS